MQTIEDAAIVLDYIKGCEDYYALSSDHAAFHPVAGELTPDSLARYWSTLDACPGCYPMRPDSTVWWAVLDFDNKPHAPDVGWLDKAEAAFWALQGVGLDPRIEISYSGHAAHVWVFFDEPIPAWLVRHVLRTICERADVPLDEIYPRQDWLTGKGMGNLVRYPFFGKSCGYDPELREKVDSPAKWLEGCEKSSEAALRQIIYRLSGELPHTPASPGASQGVSDRVDKLVNSNLHSLAARRWRGDLEGLNDRSRSALLFSLICEFVRCYVPADEIRAAVRAWSLEHGYDQGLRDSFLDVSLTNAYDHVAGRGQKAKRRVHTIFDCAQMAADEIAAGKNICWPFGVRRLDESIEGMKASELIILAARPSQGKTALALHIAKTHAAAGRGVLFLSCEMGDTEIGRRALLSMTQRQQIKDNASAIRNDIEEYKGRLKAPIYVISTADTIDDVEREIDEFVRLHGVQVVFVDYLQLLRHISHTSDYERVSDISRRMKLAAKNYNIPVVALCQLNRNSEHRERGANTMSDLRGSGQLEQDADTIIFCNHWGKGRSGVERYRYDLHIAKRRQGGTKEPFVSTTYNTDTQEFDGPVEFDHDDVLLRGEDESWG